MNSSNSVFDRKMKFRGEKKGLHRKIMTQLNFTLAFEKHIEAKTK